jgi:hypothetical protein
MSGETIKKGILTYNKGFEKIVINIGDYIQSIAAKTYYDTIDMFLEREGLNNYNEKIKIILNGWFMFSSNNWPPADKIIPKIISFHIHSRAAAFMLGEEGITYLKTHGPIGCRDYWTKALLDKYGIPCYFSGCLTLTLGIKYKETERDGKIYFVDMPQKIPGIGTMISYIPIIIRSFLSIIKIHKRQKKSLIHAALFYCTYQRVFTDDMLTNGEFIKHSYAAAMLPDDRKRFEFAEALIKKYARASLVITSRLHCALPCLGLETPVIFISKNIMDERFDGLKELLRVMTLGKRGVVTEDEVLKNVKGKISRETRIKNKEEYKIIKEKLEKECNEFMKD